MSEFILIQSWIVLIDKCLKTVPHWPPITLAPHLSSLLTLPVHVICVDFHVDLLVVVVELHVISKFPLDRINVHPWDFHPPSSLGRGVGYRPPPRDATTHIFSSCWSFIFYLLTATESSWRVDVIGKRGLTRQTSFLPNPKSHVPSIIPNICRVLPHYWIFRRAYYFPFLHSAA